MSQQKTIRKRVERNKRFGKVFTINHFMAEGISRSTVYSIIQRGTIDRKKGSGRKPCLMPKRKRNMLIRVAEGSSHTNKVKLAKEFKISRTYCHKILTQRGCKTYKKSKGLRLSKRQKTLQKIRLPKLKRFLVCSRKTPFIVMDDESYFYLRDLKMPSNSYYFARDPQQLPESTKINFYEKFPEKVLVWVCLSENGISKPFYLEGV